MKPEDLDKLQKCLDALGCALAGHDHVWTADERSLYENASRIIQNARWPCPPTKQP
jgi:hypothetical protein